MSQSSVVNAFRRRAGELGYQDITIKKLDAQLYLIHLKEPLAGYYISFHCTLDRLQILLRRSRKDERNSNF